MILMDFNKRNDVNTLLILPKRLCENTSSVLINYLLPLGKEESTKVLVCGVEVPEKGTLKKATFNEEWEQIQQLIDTYNIKNIGVAHPDYYKFILQAKKKPPFEREIGSVVKKNNLNITPILNYLAVIISPTKKPLLQKSIDTLKDLINDNFFDDKKQFIKSLNIELINDFNIAYKKLKEIINEPKISIDIETTGLKWYKDKLLTISFSTSEMSGFCIAIDEPFTKENKKMIKLLKKFFESYKGKVILHNAAFDIPFLVYNLWMNGITDTENMIKGVNYFDIEDTMVMAYLCLNNIDRPKLSLKDLAYSRYGNWDKDIEQAKLIEYSFKEVGKYNTIDTMATYYLYNKYSKMLIDEEQDDLYKTFYKKLLPAVIKMKMNGITINVEYFKNVDKELEQIYNENLQFLLSTEQVKETVNLLKEKAKRKGKRQKEIDKVEFNPKSTQHLRVLLFDVLGFEPTKISKQSGLPSTDKEVLNDLLKEVQNNTIEQKILLALKEIGEMKVVKSTFVDGFLQQYVRDKKGNAKLLGDVNITGTLSGRFSSRNP